MAEGSISELEKVKREIRSILTSSSGNSLTMRQLSNDYKSFIGRDIPFAALGFTTLTSFLNTLTDTVFLDKNAFPRGANVRLVPSNESAHIQELVNDQRKNRKTPSNRSKVQPMQMRSRNFNFTARPNVSASTHFPLQNLPAYPNVRTNCHPQPFQYQQQPFNNQLQPALFPHVQTEPLIALARMLNFQENMRQQIQLQQHIRFEQTLNALRIATNSRNTQKRAAAVRPSNENKNYVPGGQREEFSKSKAGDANSASGCQQEEVPKTKVGDVNPATEEFPKTKANDVKSIQNSEIASHTSDSEPNFSGFSNIPPQDSDISAALSENRNSMGSWCNGIIEDIDHINITDIRPTFKFESVALNIRYPAAKLPSKFENKNVIGQIELVTVCELINPSKFWIHLTSQYDELTEILEKLEETYGNASAAKNHLKEIDIQKGQLCAVLFQNIWHRGEILADQNISKCVKVSLVDYGPTITTDSSNVRALTSKLAAYPIQAFDAYLTNVQPTRNTWDAEGINKFVDMVSEAFLYARINELKAGPKLGIELIDTSNEDDVIINRKLVELGLAKGICL